MAELFANILTGAVAIAGLCIALLTYNVAQKALGEWRNEKSHNIDDEAIIHMHNAVSIIREMSYSYTDYESLEDFEKSEADKICAVNKGYFEDYVKHKYYWNKHSSNPDHQIIKNISLKVFRNSKNQDIIQFYRDYIFLTNTLFSIVLNYYAERLNNYEMHYKVTNTTEPTNLNLDLLSYIPDTILKLHKGKTRIEIAYLYFTGEGLKAWVNKLNNIEVRFYMQNNKGAI